MRFRDRPAGARCPAGTGPRSVVTMSDHPTAGAAGALFVPDGEHLVPTDLARGPWSPDALHGGPVAALAARAAERCVPAGDLQLVRVTLELLRPVPTAPLSVSASVVRPGRKVQLVEVSVGAAGTEVARAHALAIRRTPDGRPDGRPEVPTVAEDPAPAPPEAGITTPSLTDAYPAFHNGGMEIRFVKGRFDEPGPATVWFRLRCPVVAGEEPTPWERAAAAADFGNGVSAELDIGTHVFINPDLTVSLHRPPVGEWVCLDARTRFGTPGIGVAESALWDVEGRVGRAVQNLLVEPAG